MKIIYVFETTFPRQKAHTIQIMQTCHALAELGCQVWLIIGKGKSSNQDILAFYGVNAHKNLHICQLPILKAKEGGLIRFSWRGLFHFFCLLKIMWLKYNQKPNIVFLREIRLGQYLTKYRKMHKLPIIYEAHEFLYLKQLLSNEKADPAKKHAIDNTRKMEEFVYNNADRLVVITQNLKQLLQEKLDIRTPVEIIPDGTKLTNPIKTNNPRPLKRNDADKLIIYLGAITRWRGVDTLIEAMKYIKGASLLIVGGIPGSKDLTHLKNFTIQEEVTQKVAFKEFVPPYQVQDILAQADVLIIPSTSDIRIKVFASPLKLFDYMAAAKPIVACAVPSLMEILKDGENAVLVALEDPQDMARGIEKVIKDPKLAGEIARQAYIDVQNYSWEKRAEKIITLAEDCIK